MKNLGAFETLYGKTAHRIEAVSADIRLTDVERPCHVLRSVRRAVRNQKLADVGADHLRRALPPEARDRRQRSARD